MANPLLINNFDEAVADSPHKGFGLMRLVDLDSFPGAVKAGKQPATLFHTAISTVFTANAGTDIIDTGSTNISDLQTGTAVVFTTTGTLPAGLSPNTTYFLIAVSSTTAKVATTIANADAGTPIDITDAGSGTHTMTTTNPGTINHMCRDPRADVRFFQDSNMRVWYLQSGGTRLRLLVGNTITANSGAGNGIVTFQNSDSTAVYLIVFRNNAIDIVNVFGEPNLEAPSWSNSWQTMNSGSASGNRHHAIVAQDNIVYFSDARYIGSILEKPSQVFDPSNGATFTYNNQALDVPQSEVLVHLEELGLKLLACSQTSDKIYPWDRTSSSFDLPLKVPEMQVLRMQNLGNIVYVLAGTYGNIYVTNGTTVSFVRKLPDQMANNSGTLISNPITWGGIAALNGTLLFGAGVQTSGNSGLWRYYPPTNVYPGGRLILEQIPVGGSANVTAVLVVNNFYHFGYSGGADRLTTSRYSNFEAVIQTPMFRVADKTTKAQYSHLQAFIAKPAATGNMRFKYRFDTSSSFSDFPGGAAASFSFAADGANTTFDASPGLIDVENIQVQIELDGTVELVEAMLLSS